MTFDTVSLSTMAANERIRGLQVYRPIIYGSHARLLTEQEKELAPAGRTFPYYHQLPLKLMVRHPQMDSLPHVCNIPSA